MKRALLFAFPPALLAAFVSGCGGGGNGNSGFDDAQAYNDCVTEQSAALKSASTTSLPKGPFSARLVETDATSITKVVRDSVKASARERLETSRVSTLAARRCEALRPHYDYSDSMAAGGSSSSSGGSKATPSASEGDSANQASGTNNQVVGVDEADFIKNDNKFIYVVNGSHFRIVDAFPGANMHEIASVTINGEAKKLFVEGNRAVVYSSITKQGQQQTNGSDWWRPQTSECTYGESGCVPESDGTETEIAIYDLTDRTQPKLVRTLHSSSSLIAARRIGNAVHTVLGQRTSFNVPYSYVEVNDGDTEAAVNAKYAQQGTETDEAIDAQKPDGSLLPTWTDSAARGVQQSVFASSFPDGDSLTSVLSLDLTTDTDVSVTSVVSRPGWVYASADALYMSVPHQQYAGWGWFEGASDSEVSTIHKFTLGQTPNSTSYFGSGLVSGRVLNQLAMDEKDGFFRVATTSGHLPDPKAHNTLTVLEAKDGALSVAGKIDNIAPGEDIRSARFDGERGYVVTFKKTDPLFVFDLKDPRAPKVLGELKIPGFSTYIHMMDEKHLLTIGYDAADQGDFAWFTGIILQIFDVSNPADPKLTHKEVIGTRGTSSEAATNHLAFNYFAPKNLLALPMTICEGGNEQGGYGTDMTFSGLIVYEVTAEGGFKAKGRVEHPSVTDQQTNSYGYYNQACSNWWANANSEVKRSIIMDDWVYSVSESRIKANNLANLSTNVKEVAISDATTQAKQTQDF